MIHTHLGLMSKRDASDALEDLVPLNWKEMDGQTCIRFPIFENDRFSSDGKVGAWANNPPHYMCNGVRILLQAFKAGFSKKVAYYGHEEYIFWKNLKDIPSGSPDLAMDKKARLTPGESLAKMERRKTEKCVSYYEVYDSEDEKISEEEIAKTKMDEAYAMILKIVEELEDIHVKILKIEMFQNTKKYLLHQSWSKIERISSDQWVTLYHGTSEAAIVAGIEHEGLVGREVSRSVYGKGVYLTDNFNVASRFALEKCDDQRKAVVLVLRCNLGKIKEVDVHKHNHLDFLDEEGKHCNSKHVANMQYYIVAEDPQTYLEFSITFQEIDKRHVFPAKDQAQAMQLQAEARLKAKQDEAAKEQARKAQEAAKEQVRKAQEDLKKAEQAKEAAKKLEAAAQQKKLDDSIYRKEKLKLRQIHLPDKQVDLPVALDIKKNDKVKLCNMSKHNVFLEGKTGTVELIVCEDMQRKSKFLFMVLLDDQILHEEIAIKNVKREKSNKQTGHSRYGVLMKDHFAICSGNQIEHLVNNDNGASASTKQPMKIGNGASASNQQPMKIGNGASASNQQPSNSMNGASASNQQPLNSGNGASESNHRSSLKQNKDEESSSSDSSECDE